MDKLLMFNVDESNWKKAAELFGRNEESLNEDVDTIKNWLKTQHHLPEIMDDIKIKNFLILNKCSIEKTKQKIDMYYTIRSLIPDLYDDCNPNLPHMQEFMKSTYFVILPNLHEDLYRVYYIKVKLQNLYSPRSGTIQLANYQEIRLYEDCMVGEIIVADMGSFSLNDVMQITPTILAKFVAIYHKVYSLRIKAMYFINSPSYIGTLLSLLKALLKPKIFSRVSSKEFTKIETTKPSPRLLQIQVHEDSTILSKVFSKENIPKDYGGDGPSLEELQEMIQRKLTQYNSRFDKLDKLRVNESLRPEKLDNDEMLGFYGNFKKLNVD